MKKHIITFLVLSIFAGASAQSHTQAFDSVFAHVSKVDATTGILYERVLPDEHLTRYPFLTTSVQTINKETRGASDKKNSVGISAFCSFVGVSLKFNLRNNLYFQTDIGGDAYLNFLFIPRSPTLGADFGTQFYILYEDKFPKRTNTYWIVGGGLNLAGVPHIPYSKQISFKSGAKVLLGIEYMPENTSISIQIDTRMGYGIMYSTKGVKPWERNGYLPNDNPYSFFDYGFVFTLRFHFGKKN